MKSHKPVLQLFDVLGEDPLLLSHLLVPVVQLFHALCIATTQTQNDVNVRFDVGRS